MDENRPPYRLRAPGAAAPAPSYELPAYGDARRPRRRPRVDEHVIRPELDRREMIDGEIMQTFPAEFQHAVQNGDLDYLLRAHLASGYRVASDLVTRHDRDADFASDSAVVRDGIDPRTGSRYREELAFEIVSQQPRTRATRKAPTMLKRGIKRVFAVFVKQGVVAEWQPDESIKEKGRWVNLAADAKICHPSLAEPMPVGAILDAASADDTVARALDAKGNPVIREIRAKEKAAGKIEGLTAGKIEGLTAGKIEGLAAGKIEGLAAGKIEGLAEGKAEAILTVLAGRGLAPADDVRRLILGTKDLATLERWLLKAGTISSPEEIIED